MRMGLSQTSKLNAASAQSYRTMLRDVLLTPASSNEKYARHKMQEMYGLIEMLTGWYTDMHKMETDRLVNLLKLGSKVYKLYEMKDKLTVIVGGKKSENVEE
jgi:DNA-binding transcriptional regulator GbsR (MarR family)